MNILLCCVTYNCTVHWADLTYISLLIIFCIIEFVTNKSLNLEILYYFVRNDIVYTYYFILLIFTQ